MPATSALRRTLPVTAALLLAGAKENDGDAAVAKLSVEITERLRGEIRRHGRH